MFHKILIANRGEIALRIVRACRDMGIAPVAVYSDADRAAPHVLQAAEACAIGPAPARESYLHIDKVIEAARHTGCGALHPGYGFLAENPALARACADAGITFIGPSANAMEQLGAKTAARQLAVRCGVPVVPGANLPVQDVEQAETQARELGYPVLLKAVAGGGGKGMRRVNAPEELAAAWRDAGSESQNAFGDARLYLEKYLERPRHVEIQIFGDTTGHLVYLGERECSVQRRHQKIIEESPSPAVTPELRRAMGEAAVRLAREAGYTNAGTVEFLLDAAGRFYFLEVNTRLQVEHPVTEVVSGLDLVKLQIRIAAGEPLGFTQNDVRLAGHAIECRLSAEDPDQDFFPSPGKITSYRIPAGPGIRVDEGVYAGYEISPEYDPMFAKLIAWGASREEAIARIERALGEYAVTGIRTNTGLLGRILRDPEFRRGEISTSWLDEALPRLRGSSERDHAAETAALIASVLFHGRAATAQAQAASPAQSAAASSQWKTEGRRGQLDRGRPSRHDL